MGGQRISHIDGTKALHNSCINSNDLSAGDEQDSQTWSDTMSVNTELAKSSVVSRAVREKQKEVSANFCPIRARFCGPVLLVGKYLVEVDNFRQRRREQNRRAQQNYRARQEAVLNSLRTELRAKSLEISRLMKENAIMLLKTQRDRDHTGSGLWEPDIGRRRPENCPCGSKESRPFQR